MHQLWGGVFAQGTTPTAPLSGLLPRGGGAPVQVDPRGTGPSEPRGWNGPEQHFQLLKEPGVSWGCPIALPAWTEGKQGSGRGGERPLQEPRVREPALSPAHGPPSPHQGSGR